MGLERGDKTDGRGGVDVIAENLWGGKEDETQLMQNGVQVIP